MTDADSTTIVFDATVLSNFASSNSVEWLIDCLDEPYTVPAVKHEILQGIEAGHSFLEPASVAIETGEIRISDFDKDRFDPTESNLDRGEFQAFHAAWLADDTLATDDGAARQKAKRDGVSVTGSIGLLVRGVVNEEISIDRANDWFDTWIEDRGYYAPVDTVEEALPDNYEASDRP